MNRPVRNRETEVIISGKPVMVDIELAKLIDYLNKEGFKTRYCCAGHHINPGVRVCNGKQEVFKYRAYRTDGYILFEDTHLNKKLIQRLVKENEILSEKHTQTIDCLKIEDMTVRWYYRLKNRRRALEYIALLFFKSMIKCSK